MGHALVIGYGNPLRSDDGLGHRAAEMMQNGQCEVIAVHQLTPELAGEIALAERVAFVDASCATNGREAGKVSRQALKSETLPPSGLSHHVSPQSLLALAGRLYGHEPQAVLFTVEALSFDLGEKLTPPVEAALPELLQRVWDWVD